MRESERVASWILICSNSCAFNYLRTLFTIIDRLPQQFFSDRVATSKSPRGEAVGRHLLAANAASHQRAHFKQSHEDPSLAGNGAVSAVKSGSGVALSLRPPGLFQ